MQRLVHDMVVWKKSTEVFPQDNDLCLTLTLSISNTHT